MYIANIASEIFIEMGGGDPGEQDSSIPTIPAIAHWLRHNYAKMSVYGCSDFSISLANDNNYELSPEPSEVEKDILKTLYVLYHYSKLIRDNLGAAAYNTLSEVDSDGMKVRRTSRTEIAKTYVQVQKMAQEDLKSLANHYKFCKASSNIIGFEAPQVICRWKKCCCNTTETTNQS